MDMGLSGKLDGINTAERIRTTCGLPVIFLTASDDQGLLHRAKYTEPFGYLIKPFRQQDLVSAIEIALYKCQIEHKLKQREAWLSTTLRCVGEGMVVTDAVGRVEFINEIAKRILCIGETEIAGRKFSDIISLQSRLTGAVAGDLLQLAIMQGGTMDIGKDLSVVGSLQGGTELEGEICLSEVEGSIAGTVFTFRDTTIRQHEEKRYCQGLRKRAVTQLAGALSNELKQVQQTTLASAQQMFDQVNAGQPIHLAVEMMKAQGLDALSFVLHRLSVLQRNEPSFPRTLDLNALIAEAIRDLRLDIPSAVELVAKLSPELSKVLADPVHLKLAITSLILHVRDSLPEGDRIWITTRACGLDLRSRKIRANKYIRLAIGSMSTAIGTEHAQERKLAEPFSGVSPLSEQLDLRLFTVYDIVADAGGSISTRANGHGLTFEIVLPAGPDSNEQQSMASTVESQSNPLAVLLIEKDNDIRNLVVTGLDDNGFEALGARNAREALDWIDLYAAPIALLITELNMAGMSGVSLAERMTVRHPGIRAILIIDCAVDSVLREEWEKRGGRFVERPFRLQDLLGIVNEMLVPGDSQMASADPHLERKAD
jgi:DNA-binding response OmpR family regulator/signal transduction histidine kinase